VRKVAFQECGASGVAYGDSQIIKKKDRRRETKDVIQESSEIR